MAASKGPAPRTDRQHLVAIERDELGFAAGSADEQFPSGSRIAGNRSVGRQLERAFNLHAAVGQAPETQRVGHPGAHVLGQTQGFAAVGRHRNVQDRAVLPVQQPGLRPRGDVVIGLGRSRRRTGDRRRRGAALATAGASSSYKAPASGSGLAASLGRGAAVGWPSQQPA